MREWHKPTIEETESGMEVTSYLPAELDRAQSALLISETEKRRSGVMLGRRFVFFEQLSPLPVRPSRPTALLRSQISRSDSLNVVLENTGLRELTTYNNYQP